jgi:lipopolysaccharide/colanic/teichoic acid biosynthesis glycosyltransferase
MLYEAAKRSADILGALVGLFLFGFPTALAAVAIAIESPGSPFFSQERVGKGGKLFKMYKLRSMVRDAEEVLKADKEMLERYVNGSYKLENDPRVTKVGKIIRRFSLDEVPQFINILKGEMSLVGPRAYKGDELAYQQEKYPETTYQIKWIFTVKPGLTGPWQVAGRSAVPFQKRLKIDAHYAKERSLLEDMKIVIKTPFAVARGSGAY